MPRTSFARYALAIAAAVVLLVLFLPSRTSVGIALAIAGGILAVLFTWLVTVFASNVGHSPANRQKDTNETAARSSPLPATPVSAPPPVTGIPLVPTSTEMVRDRLRLLLILVRPLDADQHQAPARVAYQQISAILAKGNPDLEITTVWPPTLESLHKALQDRPCYHLAIIETTVGPHGVALENQDGLATEVAATQIATMLAEDGRIHLLLLRLTADGEVPADMLLRNGLDTLITVPASLPAEAWIGVLGEFVRSLVQGDVIARAFNIANVYLDRLEVGSRVRFGIAGRNWYSLVDRVTDGRGTRFSNVPFADGLRWQPWFRDRAENLSHLLQAVEQGAKAVAVVGERGAGITSLGIEAGHRLASAFANVVYVDCAALACPTADSALAYLARTISCSVIQEPMLVDAIAYSLKQRPTLVLLAHVHVLAPAERDRLAAMTESLPSGSCCIFLTSEPLPEVPTAVAMSPMSAKGVTSYLEWLARSEGLTVLGNMSEESVQALIKATNSNPLSIRLAVGLSERLGLLQSIRTARDAASLDGLIAIVLDSLSQRDTETASVLCQVPSPLPPDLISAILGRDAIPSLARLKRAGLMIETAYPSGYQLHPCIKRVLLTKQPADDRLLTKVANAVAGKARTIASKQRAGAMEELDSIRDEIEMLLESFLLIMDWAGAEAGPVSGRMDVVRDVALVVAPALRSAGLIYEAIKVSGSGEEAAQRLEDFGARGILLLETAENYRECRDLAAAAACYEEAAHTLELAKDYRRVADTLIRLGTMYWEANDLAAARGPFERALNWLERLQDLSGQVSALIVLGHIARARAEPSATTYYQKALSLTSGQPEMAQQVGQIHYALGRSHMEAGEALAAASEYTKAAESFLAADDSEGRMQAYLALGQAYLQLDDRERAVQALKKAAYLEEQNTMGIDASIDLSLAYMRERRWQEALDHQQRALSRALISGDRRAVAQAQNALGNVFLELGERTQAVQAYEEAATIWQELHDEAGLARTYNNLAVAYRRMGYWDKARQYLDKAVQFLEKGGDKNTLASVYNNIGLILAAQHKDKEAARFYERSLALKAELGDLYGANITNANLRALSLGRTD